MKRVLLMTAAILCILVAAAAADGAVIPDGTELRLGGGSSMLDGKPVGLLEAEIALQAYSWLEIGFTFTGIHTLERAYTDGSGRTYQAECGYSGLLLRPRLQTAGPVELGLPLRTGMGTLLFRYEHEYRDSMTWTEEVLDRVTVAVYTLGVDLRISVGGRWSATLETGYRMSSPLGTPYLSDDALQGAYGILRFGYSL